MRKDLLGLLLIFTAATAIFAYDLMAGPPEHKELPVTVESVYCQVALVSAEDGTTRSVLLDEVKREALPWLTEGDRIVLEVDETDQAIALHPPHRHSAIERVTRLISMWRSSGG